MRMFNEHVRNFELINLIAKNVIRVQRVYKWLFILFQKIWFFRFKFRAVFVFVVEFSQSFNFSIIFVFVFYICMQSLNNIFIIKNYL